MCACVTRLSVLRYYVQYIAVFTPRFGQALLPIMLRFTVQLTLFYLYWACTIRSIATINMVLPKTIIEPLAMITNGS